MSYRIIDISDTPYAGTLGGIVGGTRVGGTQRRGTATWSDCVAYDADGNARIFRAAKTRAASRKRRVATINRADNPDTLANDRALLANMSSIHEGA
jgi:hypothetical protein